MSLIIIGRMSDIFCMTVENVINIIHFWKWEFIFFLVRDLNHWQPELGLAFVAATVILSETMIFSSSSVTLWVDWDWFSIGFFSYFLHTQFMSFCTYNLEHVSPCCFPSFAVFFFLRFYLFIHERHRKRGRDICRGKSRTPPQDHDLSQREMLNYCTTQVPLTVLFY